MNNHTPTSVPRFKQVYVEIPPSPFHSFRINERMHLQVIASGNLKENTPLRPTHGSMTQQFTATTSLKRKLSDRDVSTSVMALNAKKPKFATSSGVNTADSRKKEEVSANVGTMPTIINFPNGFIYCHQCGKKRDVDGKLIFASQRILALIRSLTASIQCTLQESHPIAKHKVGKERRCHNKFCKSCLKNRYGEDVDEIKRNAGALKQKGHVDGEGYTFT
jgi:hypothetical protein